MLLRSECVCMLVKTFEKSANIRNPPPPISAVCIVCMLYRAQYRPYIVDDMLSAVFYSRGARYFLLVLPVSANALYFAFSTHQAFSNRGLRLFETYVIKNGIPYTYRPTAYCILWLPRPFIY
jgi:hypothetical protein